MNRKGDGILRKGGHGVLKRCDAYSLQQKKYQKTHVGPCDFLGGLEVVGGWFWGSCWGASFFLKHSPLEGKNRL